MSTYSTHQGNIPDSDHVPDAINFFATKRDLRSLLNAMEGRQPLQYIKAGPSDSALPEIMRSWREIPHLGVVSLGDRDQQVRYLITKWLAPVQNREVTNSRGDKTHVVDQSANPQSIGFWPGGVFEGLAVVAGEVSTCLDEPVSRHLLRLFNETLRQNYQQFDSFFMGPEATELSHAGFRLTTCINAPREYDLAPV